MQIVNRKPSLPERGKIKIGMKGKPRTTQGGKTYSPPVKLDHFIITGMDRDGEGNFIPDVELMKAIAKETGQKADHLTRIPVRLLYNDHGLNLGTRYAAYKGRSVWCSGNGAEAQRAVTAPGKYDPCECPCERIEQGYEGDPKCKINGILSVLIDGAPGVGGVWKFRTTSFNSVDGLAGSLAFMATMTGGQLANLPLMLVLREKMGILPDGKQQKIYIVAIEYAGNLDELRDAGYKIALENQTASLRIEHIEAEARKNMELDDPEAVFPGEDAADAGEEFFPEDEQGGGDPPELKVPDGAAGAEKGKAAPKKRKAKTHTVAGVADGDTVIFQDDPPAKSVEITVETGNDEPAQNNGEPPPSDDDAPPPAENLDEDVF